MDGPGGVALVAGPDLGVRALEDEAGLGVAMATQVSQDRARTEPQFVIPTRPIGLAAARPRIPEQIRDLFAQTVVLSRQRGAGGLVRLVQQASGLSEFFGPLTQALLNP